MPSQPKPESSSTDADEYCRTQLLRFRNEARATLNLPPVDHLPHELDNTPAQQQGHDTPDTTSTTMPASGENPHDSEVRVVNTGPQVGLQTDGDVHGATVVMGTSTQLPAGLPQAARNAIERAQRIREQAHTTTTTSTTTTTNADGANQRTTIRHPDGSITVHNYATGTVGIQSATEHGNTVHID